MIIIISREELSNRCILTDFIKMRNYDIYSFEALSSPDTTYELTEEEAVDLGIVREIYGEDYVL